jgi:hypothetical protein
MSGLLKQVSKTLIGLTLAAVVPAPTTLFAVEHVVPAPELHQRVNAAAAKREQDLAKVRGFFSSQQALKALKSAGVDPTRVERAASVLSDEDLARIAARSDKVQTGFAAGELDNQQLTYIIIALATAVLILVIVAA